MTENQKSAIEELEKHYKQTRFNYYLKLTLVNKTGITDNELYDLHEKGIIGRTLNINKQTLIILRKYE